MLRGKDPRAYEKYMEIKKWRKEDSFSDKHMNRRNNIRSTIKS